MRKVLGLALRVALVLGGLAYAFWGVDLDALGKSLAAYDVVYIALATLAMLGANWVASWKTITLSGGRAGARTAFESYMLGVGLNCVFPAKLGEIGKIYYLRLKAGIPLAEGFAISFWDNLTQISVYFFVFLCVVGTSGFGAVSVSLILLLMALWVFLLAAMKRLELVEAVIRLVPLAWFRARLRSVVLPLFTNIRFRGLLQQLLVSALACLVVFLCVLSALYAANIRLTLSQSALVFCASTLSCIIPSSPAAIGVFEASVIAALTFCNVGKQEALASAMLLHAIFVIPQVAGGAVILLRGRISIRELMAGREQHASAGQNPGERPA